MGDVGFALGIMLIWVSTGTLDIRESFELIAELDDATIAAIAFLVFCGAVGKSAQFPLHVWLPDAMEGPTPVSALIHAATMVNAGVYLVARANPIFALAPGVMVIVAAIGIFTAILAASIAFTQTDIKRVLAYSTLSQLGLMFAGLGVGAFVAAIFHLMAHGFFKGLLFLGSGSVIHAVHEEQDMNNMGGLHRRIPVTHWTMLIGTLAIAGIPPLAGFFSKDEILAESFKFGFYWVWAIGFVVAGMTAFYMWRLMGKTFYGPAVGVRAPDLGPDPRVHLDDDRAACPPGVRIRAAGDLPRHSAGGLADRPLARAGLRRVGGDAPPGQAGLRAVRHRRCPHPRQRRHRHGGSRRSGSGSSAPSAAPATRRASGRSRTPTAPPASSTGPASTSGGSTT